MLRSFEEKGGIGVYTRNIVSELLDLDCQNVFVLFYRNSEHIGNFSNYNNVEEHLVKGANKAIWDQIAIPFACWRYNVDILFHPKFTAPLLAPCKVVMTVHGADWFIPEQAQYYKSLDVRYIRTVMPLYFRKCDTVISVSQLTTENFNHVLDLPPGKVQTVYFAPARHFSPVSHPATLNQVKEKYALPDSFILTLSKPDGDARKNISQVFKSYARYHELVKESCKLVVGGKDCHRFRDQYRVPVDGYGQDIFFPGYIEQEDLPAVYSQAKLFLYPSNLEAFPIPITEAMACGTPIVTSEANGLQEIAGEAAILVDPNDTELIAQAINQILGDPQLSDHLSSKGLERAKMFNWDKCARKTLEILEKAVA